jgi:serine/threonine protein kinase
MNHAEVPGTIDAQANGLQSVGSGLDDPRTLAAVEEYLAELESGRRPDRRQFLARYPELADVLAHCLDGLDFVRQTAPALAAPETSEPPAKSLGDFRIRCELGRGGMGIVYRARQIRLNRPCALKMILAGAHANDEANARFLAEAEAVARLQHANVVQIRHIGETGGLPFFELEFLDGGSLDRRLNGTP